MRRSLKFFWLLMLIGAAISASAHTPTFVASADWVKVSEPEKSQAFYGFLSQGTTKFVVSSSSPFILSLSLLTPANEAPDPTLQALIVSQTGQVIGQLATTTSGWTRWYEEYAGDSYYRGPHFQTQVNAGTYTVVVNSRHRNARYVLTVGEKEVFSVDHWWALEKELYLIKTKFFGAPWYAIFAGRVGTWNLGLLLVASLLGWGAFWLGRCFRSRRGKQNK